MAKVLCATPRSGSTAIGNLMAERDNSIDTYIEFLNPRYMQGLYGTEWDAKHQEFLKAPRMGLKLMREHMTEEAIEYIEYHGAYLCTRIDKIAQAVSYYFSTATGHWYRGDASGPPPKFDFDKILMHMSRIILQEEAWIDFFHARNIHWEPLVYEDFIDNGHLRYGDRDPSHAGAKSKMTIQFHDALWNRTSMEWSNTFRGEWKGEKV